MALGTLLTPLAAILAFVDPGLAKDQDCSQLLAQAHEEAARESSRAREGLRQEVSKLAVAGASRLLEREVDPKTHAELLDKLSAEVARG